MFLNGNALTASGLPAGVFDALPSLTSLQLNDNALSTLPAGVFDALTGLDYLYLNDNGLTSLPADAFDTLSGLEHLHLQNNKLRALPVGVFDGLPALKNLHLPGNRLKANGLPAGVFGGLAALEKLDLSSNKLKSLNAGLFEPLTALADLDLSNNDGAPFAPEARAEPDDGEVSSDGGTVRLDGIGSGGAWGTNVTYAWALTDPASGVTVSFDDAASAMPEVTIPALAPDTELTFTLTVATPHGTTDGVRAGMDTATVTATATGNIAPTGADTTVTTDEDTAYAFAAADFGFSDVDSGDTLASVTITTLPGAGALELHGTAISSSGLPRTVTAAELADGELTYTPPAGASGDAFATFRYKVNDGTDDSASAYTMTIDVVDTTAPTVEITGVPATSSAAFTATFTFSEAVTGFALSDIAVSNGAASGFAEPTAGTVFTALITPTTDGAVTVDVAADAAQDAAGNANTAAVQATSTYTAPVTNTAPAFPSDATPRAVAENTATGTDFDAPVAARDEDNDPLAYELTAGDVDAFAIDPATGQLSTVAALNHEEQATYTVTVTATDDEDASASTEVTITVTDVDEQAGTPNAPRVRKHTSVTKLSVRWDVPDTAGGPAIINYEIRVAVKDSAAWSVVTTSDATTSAELSDLQRDTAYDVQVKANNGEIASDWSPSGNGTTRDNNAPNFDDRFIQNRTVSESVPAGSNVGAPIDATDQDGDPITHWIRTPSAHDLFAIDETTGQITTKRMFDHEAEDEYRIQILVTDRYGADEDWNPQTDSLDVFNSEVADLRISITDEAEPPLIPAAPTVTGDSSTSLLVTWTAPDNTGRPDIEGYALQYRKQGEPGWTPGPSTVTHTQTTIANLEPGTLYEVSVRASNDEGTSDWSTSGEGATLATDATLSELTVSDETSALTLAPAFASGTFVYTTEVASTVSQVTLTAVTTDDGASVSAVTLDGNAIADDDFSDGITVPSLVVGNNAIVVTVTAEDGVSTRTYMVTVTRTAANDPATGAPTITGTAQVGQTLTAERGNIDDTDGLSATFPDDYTFQWVRVDASNTETDIGTDSRTYTPVVADVGATIKVAVSFTDNAGHAEGPLVSAAVGPVEALAAVTIEANHERIGAGVEDLKFTLTRAGSTARALDVTVEIDQEQEWLDTSNLSHTVTFVAGVDTATLVFAASEVSLDPETTGTLTATASGTGISGGEATVAVVSLAHPPITIAFDQDAYTFAEAAPAADVNIYMVATLDPAYPRVVPVSGIWVSFETDSGTARSLDDFGLISGRAILGTGDLEPGTRQVARGLFREGNRKFTIVDDDSYEGDEALEVVVGWDPVNQSGLVRYRYVDGTFCDGGCSRIPYPVTITDEGDRPVLSLSAAPASIAEADNGATPDAGNVSTLTASIDNAKTFAADQAVTLTFAGTASAADYTVAPADADAAAAGHQVTLPADAPSVAVTVTAVDNDAVDGDRTVEVTGSLDGADFGATQTITITDDEVENTAPTGAPEITGTPQVGQELTAAIGTMADIDGLPATFPDDYTFQWVRVDASNTETDIGTNSSTYTPVAADVGATIKVEVSFTDGGGTAEEPLASAAVGPVVAAAANCAADRPGNDWCATMTVGVDSQRENYGYSSATSLGSLSSTRIEYGTKSWTIRDVRRSVNAIEDLIFVASQPQVPEEIRFNLGGEEFPAGDGADAGIGYTWETPTGLAWIEGQKVTVSARFGNFAASGKPGITGTAQVGETLTATTTGITDADGTTKADNGDAGYAYTYQWVLVDGGG